MQLSRMEVKHVCLRRALKAVANGCWFDHIQYRARNTHVKKSCILVCYPASTITYYYPTKLHVNLFVFANPVQITDKQSTSP